VLLASLRRLYSRAEILGTAKAFARVLPAVGFMILVTYPASVLARHPWMLGSFGPPALAGLGLLGLGGYAAGLWTFSRRELVVHVGLLHRRFARGRLARASAGAEEARR